MKQRDHLIPASEHIHLHIPVASISNSSKLRIKFAFFLTLIGYIGTCSLLCGWSFRTIILLSISAVLIIILRRTYRSWSSAVIKGDTIILKNTDDKASVTHVRSIRSISSKRFGKKHFTSLKYKLDGAQHKALLISDVNENDPPQLMIRRIQRELKNKKANL